MSKKLERQSEDPLEQRPAESSLGREGAGSASEAPSDTRTRLLAAAREAFAQHGYRRAGVREICSLAGANGAAVNYHFGGKEELYHAVLREEFARVHEGERMPTLPEPLGPPCEASPKLAEQVLRAWIRWKLERVLDHESSQVGFTLMMQEIADPSPAMGMLAMGPIGAMHLELQRMVAAVAGISAEDPRAGGLAVYVLSLCAMQRIGQPVHEALVAAKLLILPESVAERAEHIAAFAIGGCRSLSARPTGEQSQ